MQEPTFLQEVKITLWDKPYTVGFPNIEQYIEIEKRKQILTGGRYALMAFSNTVESGLIALDFVDAIAYFSVLIPQLILDCKLKDYNDFLQLDYIKGMQMADCYNAQYVEFYNQFVSEVNKLRGGVKLDEQPTQAPTGTDAV